MEPVEVPIDGILDLHVFQPREVEDLIPEYIRACRQKGIRQIRIIHGKGKGVLRRIVHSLLERHPLVAGFSLDSGGSGWGATVAYLKKEN